LEIKRRYVKSSVLGNGAPYIDFAVIRLTRTWT